MDEFEGNPNPLAGPSSSNRSEEEEPIFDGGLIGDDEEDHATEDARDELYSILNISKDATQQEIAASYKKLAGKYINHHFISSFCFVFGFFAFE